MNVVSRSTLTGFWSKNPTAKAPLEAWYAIAHRSTWTGPQDIKDQFRSADFLADNRVVFDIGGNNYRLVVHVSYTFKAVNIKFIGTHAEYSKIDPVTI